MTSGTGWGGVQLLPRQATRKRASTISSNAPQIKRSGCGPLLEVQLELVAPDVVWSPELGSSGGEPGCLHQRCVRLHQNSLHRAPQPASQRLRS